MKKLLSLALATVMLFMISATVCAQEITDNSGSVTVTYTSEVTYTVTIPDSMTIGTPAEVSVSDVTIGADQGLSVTVSSDQYNEGWQLTDGTNNVGYTLKIGNSYDDLANGGEVLYATAGENVTTTLNTVLKASPIYSGTFTDTLTFSVDIVVKNITQAEAEDLVAKCSALVTELKASGANSSAHPLYTDTETLNIMSQTFNQKITAFFINQDGSYTQEQINTEYSRILEKYNALKAKASA